MANFMPVDVIEIVTGCTKDGDKDRKNGWLLLWSKTYIKPS
ncbi:predicted protein [Sclerotinia sclerotiorum 1980 UF-70]|uniref:Uncharacterized protein n=1 Tax=Sclerotinia sclerotiorum (strain ATCC 18683 / 1980 / Ss-1) TaxID=665079 RepID=A7ETN6_SCLS1|nr:predicted protein [Sclerotinia sclerotiorum 1980 UF-70]EDN92828.1 predicted protein [Sclerotinia sclerotiorum 1980 UF-70]